MGGVMERWLQPACHLNLAKLRLRLKTQDFNTQDEEVVLMTAALAFQAL